MDFLENAVWGAVMVFIGIIAVSCVLDFFGFMVSVP